MFMSQLGGVYRHLSLPSDGDTRIAPGFCHWDNRTRIDLASTAALAWLHEDGGTRSGPTGMALLEQHWNGLARMVAPAQLHCNDGTGTGHARLALGWP